MKKYTFFVLFVILTQAVTAQKGLVFNKFQGGKYKDRSNTVMIGIKGGVTIPKVIYNYSDYNEIEQINNFKPAFGIFVDMPLTKSLSISPELMYLNRGVSHENFPYRDIYTANYLLSADYVAIRLPFIFRANAGGVVQPYIFAAPDVAFCLSAEAEYSIYQGQTPLFEHYDNLNIPEDIRFLDLSVLVGAGLRFNINFKRFSLVSKLDVGYNYGLINTYGKDVEHNVHSDLSRRNNPLEVMFSLGLPLKFSQPDACVNFGKYDRRY